jgi:hypothetical protein
MSVRVAFTATNFIIPRMIRFFTKGRTSHTMLGYDDDLWGGSWISEATLGGVQNRPAERSMHNIVAVFTCKFDATLAIRDLREHVGDHFDYPGLVLFYWPKVIWRLFHRKMEINIFRVLFRVRGLVPFGSGSARFGSTAGWATQ